MRSFEAWAAGQVSAGSDRVLEYNVSDEYSHPDSGTIPVGYWYVAMSTLPDGADPITEALYVPNAGYNRYGVCLNIGAQNIVASSDCG